jgi:hypothetical protein
MAKRTLKMLLVLFLIYFAFGLLMDGIGSWTGGNLFVQDVTYIIGRAAIFFQVTVMTVLYFNNSQPEPIEETEDEEIDHFLLDAIAESENIEDTFQYRVEPSLDFDDVGEFCCGLARVRQTRLLGKGKWGYVNTDGEIVLPFVYKEASDFYDGVAVVREGRFEYFIDTAGNKIIDVGYEQADRFRENLAVVKLDSYWVVIDIEGDGQRLPYDNVYGFSEGFAVVNSGEKWFYINKDLSPVFSTEYDAAWSFNNGLAMVEKDGKRGFIDKDGKFVIPLQYDNALSFSEGLAAVMTTIDGKDCWSYIDKNGHTVIPVAFDRADSFQQGRAAVCVDRKYGHINTKGEFITSPKYGAAGSFSDDFALVGDVAYGYVDINGREFTSLFYQDARPFSENLAWVKTEVGWGILEIKKF